MVAAVEPMSDKKELRDDVSTKIDRTVLQLAKAAAALDGVSVAEWLSELARREATVRLATPKPVKTFIKVDPIFTAKPSRPTPAPRPGR